ncbi:hypothetical protein [Elizabethkingia occulta]|uniref:hypothetical protein n=1 Tax=Elizabethkingia occulta TaxID=1867263 RepID=UPI00099AEB59|nr:hypothetical protein [Elizabethkingia occulta]OPB92548.1 hypothetical protein BB020_08065 [Elizabethkingia occulta]
MKPMLLILLIGTAVILLSCKKRQVNETKNADTLITEDSTVVGTTPVSPDSLDDRAVTDSTKKVMDSIKKSK